jgi:hypothetical protein
MPLYTTCFLLLPRPSPTRSSATSSANTRDVMCGRVRLSSDVSEIRLVFRNPPERPIPNFPPSWNAAPTDSLPVVRFDAKAGQRSLDMLRWGLIPYWAKDIKVGFANINAKAEGIENRRLSARRSSIGAVLCRSIIFTSGRKRTGANSLMPSRSPTAASWHSRAYGRTGIRRPASGFALSRSSLHSQTSCAQSSTTGCPW